MYVLCGVCACVCIHLCVSVLSRYPNNLSYQTRIEKLCDFFYFFFPFTSFPLLPLSLADQVGIWRRFMTPLVLYYIEYFISTNSSISRSDICSIRNGFWSKGG